jgi:hypothetical protein
MHQTHAIPRIMKRYVNNEIKNHEKNISQAHPVQKCVFIMHNTYVHQPYTSTSFNVPKGIIHGMYQSYASINMPTCASTNMPTIFIHQYSNHVHLLICQPCASTNMSTMYIYQYSNHVHLLICQPCASTNMKTMCHINHDMSSS